MDRVINNLHPEWADLVTELTRQAKTIGIGVFSTDGSLLYANAIMIYFLDVDAKNQQARNFFVNPRFQSFAEGPEGLVFEGLSTIGNYSDMSFVLQAKVYRKAASLLVFVEADVVNLFEENKKMSYLNQEVNNLQRQLIKEKKQLQVTLSELKETQQMLIHSEKMNALGKLVAGVAHEVNNPIAFVYSNLHSTEEYLSEVFETIKIYEENIKQLGSPELIDLITEIRQKYDLDFLESDIPQMISESKVGVERVKGIVEDLRRFSRLDESDLKEVDLIENIRSTITIIKSEMTGKNIHFSLNLPEKLRFICYPGQLNQAILNILMNAIQAVDQGGSVNLSVVLEENALMISIQDNGPGIPEEIKNRIFEPFFTTKPVGSGTGLGLSITYKIVTDLHRGKVNVYSDVGKGTLFELILPVHGAHI